MPLSTSFMANKNFVCVCVCSHSCRPEVTPDIISQDQEVIHIGRNLESLRKESQ